MSALAPGLRLDAEYYKPTYLADAERIEKFNWRALGSLGFVTDGIHASPDVVEDGGVRYLSAKSVKDNSFALGDSLLISDSQNAANSKTQLKIDDVLLTTVGTIGNAAVVQSAVLPANIDRHLGLIRLSADS